MKFLCDHCKTRYSIGDERVRGKILKIRCKNCANVITVREGMVADADGSPPVAAEYVGRAKKATLMAPTAINEDSESAGGANDPVRAAMDRGGAAGPLGAAGLAGPGRMAAPAGSAGPATPAIAARSPAGSARAPVGAPGAAQAARPTDEAGRGQGAGRRGVAPEAARGEPVNALNAAFASAMAKPPPALEEEWYVSLDGDQAGPFSLVEAQRWVAQQPVDAELHCWSEGFDDWLPVDKVSHFRGLRKRPAAPAAPPPLPRLGGGSPRPAPGASGPALAEAEPKPLFAATMASLERGASGASKSGPSLPSPATPSARATPLLGSQVPARGSPAGGAPNGVHDDGVRKGPVTPLAARAMDDRLAALKPAGSPPGSARGSLADDPFDISEGVDGQTQLEDMPFADSIVETRRPSQPAVSADPSPGSSDAALTRPHMPASSTLPGTGANAAATTAAVASAAAEINDDELDIGEVSRVVKLADIVRKPSNPDQPGPVRRSKPTTIGGARQSNASPLAPGMAGPARRSRPTTIGGGRPPNAGLLRSTGSVPSIPGTGDAASDALFEAEPGMTMAPITTSHRRGLIALLTVASVMVIGVGGAVILLVITNDDTTSGDLGSVHDIDTSRPEDPITHRPIAAGPIAPTNPTPNPFVPRPTPRGPRPTPGPAGSNHEPDPLPGNSLRGDEIEDIARKHQDMTQRCYMRSQRGADSILIGDVKKIAVTLIIDKDGNVGDVQLSEHAADNLGKCLAGSIRSWKFRPSSGGTFRFSLNFVSG